MPRFLSHRPLPVFAVLGTALIGALLVSGSALAAENHPPPAAPVAQSQADLDYDAGHDAGRALARDESRLLEMGGGFAVGFLMPLPVWGAAAAILVLAPDMLPVSSKGEVRKGSKGFRRGHREGYASETHDERMWYGVGGLVAGVGTSMALTALTTLAGAVFFFVVLSVGSPFSVWTGATPVGAPPSSTTSAAVASMRGGLNLNSLATLARGARE